MTFENERAKLNKFNELMANTMNAYSNSEKFADFKAHIASLKEEAEHELAHLRKMEWEWINIDECQDEFNCWFGDLLPEDQGLY